MSVFALLLVLSAAVCHATWNVLAHGVSRVGLPFLWWGAVASTVIWAPLIPLTGGLGNGGADALGGFVAGAGVSGVLHVIYMLVLQQGYARGRLSTVYATARGTGPALSALLAVLLLGERIAPPAVVGVAIIVLGVVATGLIDRRSPTRHAPRRRLDPSIVFGVLTGVAIATYTIWDAHALRTWGLAPVAFMVGCTLVEIVLYAPWVVQRRSELASVARAHWPRILAFGVFSPLSYILILTAVTMAPVALVAPIREVSVVLVSLFGAMVLREGAAVRRVAASVVVVGGVVLLAL
ncbi:EamA family transporter [Mycetocola sp.]|uniref:EamA family transporter n=1 Tax=Mycetocola sp. TaxID=1871042 RepID=UPI0039896C02